MTKLRLYLVRLFIFDSAALLGVAAMLLFLAQCLRVMDATSLRGTAFGVLVSQALLGLPQLLLMVFFICVAIGLARALRGLAASRELHAIHAGRRLPALLRAILVFSVGAAIVALLVAHQLAPMSLRAANELRSRVAADLVSRSLVPNRFAQVGDGVTITVGGRRANGEITTFFADDNRNPDLRRTYIARTALLTADERGYVMQLVDGTIQYRNSNNQFSEISFNRYDMVLDRLVADSDSDERVAEVTSLTLAERAAAAGAWQPAMLDEVLKRGIEGLRVLALCAFVAAIASFPSGRRKAPAMPIEVTVLVVAVFERAISTYLPGGGALPAAAGAIVLLVVSLFVLLVRLRVFMPLPRPERVR